MRKIMYAAMLLLGLSMTTVSCDGGSTVQDVAIAYMEANLHEDGEWYPGDYDMDELEEALVELDAPEFKSGQHAIELVEDLYGSEQSYIVWVQDSEVYHYEMTGNVTAGRIKNIYSKMKSKGWR